MWRWRNAGWILTIGSSFVAAQTPLPEPVAVVAPVSAVVESPLATPAPAPVAVPLTPTVIAEPAPVAVAAPPADDLQFPRYALIKPKIAFWSKIFGEYSVNQSVIHSTEYPAKVFEVLDFRADAVRLDESALARLRSSSERASKERIDALLKKVNALRDTPDLMTGEQRKIYELYADVKGDDRFKDAIGTFRAQRGLKERTAMALETSGKYLPEMEGIFKGYQLPLKLTRLPLVESSFNVEAYSKVGAAGLWQFMPSSAKIYMRLDELVDDRRDPWTSTDAAARHLRDDYAMLGSWPLALTAYNHGRGGVARGLRETGGTDLTDLIRGYKAKSFGFASQNFYAEFLAASDVEREWQKHFGKLDRKTPLRYDLVETKHYVPYETLRKLCGADDESFRKLNPAYRPEVMDGKLYVPPGHVIRVPAGQAKSFEVAYSKLGSSERFDAQRVYFLLHKVAKGQSLGKIAKQYGVSQGSIKSANGLKDAAKLRAGQVLKIPPREERRPGPVLVAVGESKAGLTAQETQVAVIERSKEAAPRARPGLRTHKVQSGQTLSSIARRYKVSVAQLQKVNDLGSSSHIKPGQKLRVPNT